MIEINLLPEELKKRKKKAAPKIEMPTIRIESIPFVKIGFISAGALVVLQIAIFGVGLVGGIILSKLESNYKKITPQKTEADSLKTQLSKMSRKISAIDELMVKRFSWAKKLNDLSDSMTPGIWLTQLEYDEKLIERPRAGGANLSKGKEGAEAKIATEKVLQKYLIISGAASSMGEEGTALIGRFIKSLKDNASFYSDFSDIELGNIKREKMEDQEIMTFRITCLFKIKDKNADRS